MNTVSSEPPSALARLIIPPQLERSPLWIVDFCPLCCCQHTHGAGGRDGDPLRSLGHRVAHCLVDVAPRGYILVQCDPNRRQCSKCGVWIEAPRGLLFPNPVTGMMMLSARAKRLLARMHGGGAVSKLDIWICDPCATSLQRLAEDDFMRRRGRAPRGRERWSFASGVP